MACRLPSAVHHRECVLLDQETLGQFPAEQETMDAETRVGAEGLFIQCETGAHGSLCEGTEGSVVDSR